MNFLQKYINYIVTTSIVLLIYIVFVSLIFEYNSTINEYDSFSNMLYDENKCTDYNANMPYRFSIDDDEFLIKDFEWDYSIYNIYNNTKNPNKPFSKISNESFTKGSSQYIDHKYKLSKIYGYKDMYNNLDSKLFIMRANINSKPNTVVCYVPETIKEFINLTVVEEQL